MLNIRTMRTLLLGIQQNACVGELNCGVRGAKQDCFPARVELTKVWSSGAYERTRKFTREDYVGTVVKEQIRSDLDWRKK